jgi:hypothetical protein
LLAHTDLDTPLTALLAAPHWYVAFSGGLDSTVLLHLVHRWRMLIIPMRRHWPPSTSTTACKRPQPIGSAIAKRGAASWQLPC